MIKNILVKLFVGQKGDDYNKYIEGDSESLRMSEIGMDLRKPVDGKKYIRLGPESSVHIRGIFETEEGYIDIGKRVFIGGGCQIITKSNVTIDENVQIAWNCLLYDHNAHSLNYLDRRNDIDVYLNNYRMGRDVSKNYGKNWEVVKSAPIHICHDAWIGANVTILAGVTIGAGAIVGAGSVVRNDIPAWSIAYGNPCRVVASNRFVEEG